MTDRATNKQHRKKEQFAGLSLLRLLQESLQPKGNIFPRGLWPTGLQTT